MKNYLFFILCTACCPFSFSRPGDNGNHVKGVVVDSIHSPLPGIMVSLDSTVYHTLTGSKGGFYLFNIPDGNYTLKISALGFNRKTIRIHLSGNSLLDLDTIQLQESVFGLSGITVTGEATGEAKAINKTKTSPQLVTITSSEEIAKLPNKNAADIVSHNPGVATQRNKGEGSVVSIRGTPSDWSAILVNGDRLPVACDENTTRSFEFEAFPAALVDQVAESRTTTPDMESDNIGGSINFTTKSPEFKKIFTADIAGGMSVLAKKPAGTINVLWGDVSKNGKFSFIINACSYSRHYAADAAKVVYGSNFHHGINRLELRRHDGFRGTFGGSMGAEYKYSSQFRTGVRFFSGFMLDDKHMNKQSFNWFEDSGRRIRLQSVYGKQHRLIMGGEVYTDYSPSERFSLKTRMAFYSNEFNYGPFPVKKKNDPRNGLYVMEFISPIINFTDFSKVDAGGKAVDPNSTDYILVKLAGSDNPYGNESLRPSYSNKLSMRDFQYERSYSEGNNTRERDPAVVQSDAVYKVNNRLSLQMGVKYRNKTGYRHIIKHEWFQDFSQGSSAPIRLEAFETGPFSHSGGMFLREEGIVYDDLLMPFLSQKALEGFVRDFEGKLREVYMNELHPEYRLWVGSEYEYTEHQAGAYAQAGFKTEKLNILAGIRVEYTRLMEKSDTLTGKTAFDPVTSTYYYLPEERFANREYTEPLPSLNATFYIREHINLRFAVSQTLHRPNFEETKPGHAVIKYNELEYTFGNPGLKPATSFNLDACFEYFYGLKGMWSVGSYYKKINNHIFAATTPSSDPASGIIIRQYSNATDSWVMGLEGVFVRRFDFLKAPWNGLGVSANISYSVSRMPVPGRPENQPMTNQTPLLYNFSLMFKRKKFDSKLALGYNGRYLTQLNLAAIKGTGLLHKDSDFDIFMKEYYSLDCLLSYEFSEKYSVYAEANNLLNSPEKKYIGKPWRIYSVEYYRFKAQIGFRYSF